MAITNEEVKIKLGVDASTVETSLNGVSGKFDKFAKGVGSRLRGMLTTNVFLAGSVLWGQLENALAEIIPWRQEFWDRVYGVDKDSTAALEKGISNLRRLRAELKTAMDALAKTRRDATFEDASGLGKTAILEREGGTLLQRNLEIERQIKANQKQIADAKRQLAQKPPAIETFAQTVAGPLGGVTSVELETLDSRNRRAKFDAMQKAARSRIESGIAGNAALTAEAATNEKDMIKLGRELQKVYDGVASARDSAMADYNRIPVELRPLPPLNDVRGPAALEMYRKAGPQFQDLADQIAERLQYLPVVIKAVEE